MQEKNEELNWPAKPGDGTLRASEPMPAANWFGASQEPQEEYINSGIDEFGPAPETEQRHPSDSSATLPQPESREPKSHEPESENSEVKPLGPREVKPMAPAEIFPYGNPGEQADG